jgi:hypothetical protein
MSALGVNMNGDSSPSLPADTSVHNSETTHRKDDFHQDMNNNNKEKCLNKDENIDNDSKNGIHTRKAPTFSVKEVLKNPALARLLILASKKVKAENETKNQI